MLPRQGGAKLNFFKLARNKGDAHLLDGIVLACLFFIKMREGEFAIIYLFFSSRLVIRGNGIAFNKVAFINWHLKNVNKASIPNGIRVKKKNSK